MKLRPINNRHGKSPSGGTMLAIVGILAFVAILLFSPIGTAIAGMFNTQSVGGGGQQPAVTDPSQLSAMCSSVGETCFNTDTGQNDIDFVLYNTQNNTDEWLAGTVWFGGPNGETYASATVAADVAAKPAYSTIAAPGCQVGSIFVLSDAHLVGQKVTANSCRALKAWDINAQKASRITFALYDRSGANNINATGVAQFSTEINTTANAMGQGDNFKFVAELRRSTSDGAMGSPDEGVIIYADIRDTGSISKDAISITSSDINVQKLDACPKESGVTDYGDADVCWKLPQLNDATVTGDPQLTISINADNGNPGATGDVWFYVDDYAYHVDNNKVTQSVFDSGGNNEGVARSYFVADLS